MRLPGETEAPQPKDDTEGGANSSLYMAVLLIAVLGLGAGVGYFYWTLNPTTSNPTTANASNPAPPTASQPYYITLKITGSTSVLLSGRVTDKNNNPVGNVKVTLYPVRLNQNTTADGIYSFSYSLIGAGSGDTIFFTQTHNSTAYITSNRITVSH